jgi:hypothetical protein
MSITFYDVFEPEPAEGPSARASDPRYRLEVVLDAHGRLVSADAEPAAIGLIEHLARGLGVSPRR